MDPGSLAHFTNGLDLHFDYDRDSPQEKTAKRKKKKKKKKIILPQSYPVGSAAAGKSPSSILLSAVDLADPYADYPENRVIKVGPNGDLIVESLDDDYEHQKIPKHSSSPQNGKLRDSIDDGQTFLNLHGNLERSMFHFKDELERRFWMGLSDEERKEILNIDLDLIVSRFKNQRRLSGGRTPADGGMKSSASCKCENCGQNITLIQQALEIAYQPHMNDFIESTWQTTVDGENTQPQKNLQELPVNLGSLGSPDLSKAPELPSDEDHVRTDHNTDKDDALRNNITGLSEITEGTDGLNGPISDYSKDPRFQALVAHYKLSIGPERYSYALRYPTPFIECLYNISKEGKEGLTKSIEFLKHACTMELRTSEEAANMANFMSALADMILKDDGKNFINIVEDIKRKESSKEGGRHDPSPSIVPNSTDDEAQAGEETVYMQGRGILHGQAHLHNHADVRFHGHSHGRSHSHGCFDYSNSYSGSNSDADHSYSDENELEDDEDLYDFEGNHQERVEELRGLFMIQAVHMIRQNFRLLYEKKVSEDRTRQFIEELEAEENAKKERELKKLKQKEEQREKKRLQQLAKEDEKQKRLDAEREKAAVLKQQQEAVRAEQLRRKEETRLRKMQEKERKIEALKKKEQDKRSEEIIREKERLERVSMEKKKNERLEKETTETERAEKEKLEKSKKEELEQEKLKLQRLEKEIDKETNDRVTREAAERQFIGSRDLYSEAGSLDRTHENSFFSAPSLSQTQFSSYLSAGSPAQNQLGLDTATNASLTPPGLQSTITPTTNHLLEQLYHLQPPLPLPGKPSPEALDSMVGQGSQSQVPQKSLELLGTVIAPPITTVPTVKNVPDIWAPNSSSSRPLVETQNSLWHPSYSRNDSIWRSSSAALWGANPALVTPAAGPAGLSGFMSNLQGLARQPLQSMANLQSALLNNHYHPPSFVPGEVPREAIQAAGVEAFQILQQGNQLQFGAAGAHALFLVAKTVLQNPELPFSEFLRSLNTPNLTLFELVYDDFGGVTHIKIQQPDFSFNGTIRGADSSAMYTSGTTYDKPSGFSSSFTASQYDYEDDLSKRQIW